MYKEKNFRLLLSILALVFVVFVPRATMAEEDEGQLSLVLGFTDKFLDGIGSIPNLTEYSHDLKSDGKIVDFSDPEFKNYDISGEIIYHKSTNTVEFKDVKNEGKYELGLSLGALSPKQMTVKFEGDNNIQGYIELNAPAYKAPPAILTGNLRLKTTLFPTSLQICPHVGLIVEKWKISNASLEIQNLENGLEYNGHKPLEVINSTIKINDIPPNNHTYSGYYGKCGLSVSSIEFLNSSISIKQIYGEDNDNKGVYGLYSTNKILSNASKIDIETKHSGKNAAIYAAGYVGEGLNESLVDFTNSEVYLKSSLISAKDEAEAYAILSDGMYDDYKEALLGFVNINNSFFQAQGDTNAIKGVLDFRESQHDVYVKENLNDEKTLYQATYNNKKYLGTYRNGPEGKYKFVEIAPHLKSFNIDADSQMVDQNIYEFVRWEAKGFIIDEPNKKNTKVKIPIILPKDAYIRAIWKKNDGTITVVPETKYETIYKTNTVYDTKTVYKNTLSAMSYLAGYPDNTIKPEGNMTRAEAIATLVRLERLKNKDGRSLQDKDKSLYSDVKDGDWYKKYINFAYHQGWLEEKSGEKFYPDRPITRGELAQLISHVDKKTSAPASFDDVRGHKYEAAINQAYANGRIKGYEDGSFRPDGKIKRAEVATMLNHLYDRRPDKSFIYKHSNIITSFNDLDKNYWGYYELVEAFEAHEYVINDKGEIEWVRLIDSNVK